MNRLKNVKYRQVVVKYRQVVAILNKLNFTTKEK